MNTFTIHVEIAGLTVGVDYNVANEGHRCCTFRGAIDVVERISCISHDDAAANHQQLPGCLR